ncbi:MAG TPA: DinB family protein [Planctomycetota bacterium]
MTTPVRWFERVFPGGYPVELFPSLVSRLRGAIARQRAEGEETPAAVRRTPFEGTWSVQRNLAHLGDLEPLWLRRVEELERGVEVLAAADLSNGRTEEREHDRRELEDVLREFAEARRILVERVAGWSPAQLERSALHPRLRQPMRAIDLCLFVAEHDDHHLARVAELRAAFRIQAQRRG